MAAIATASAAWRSSTYCSAACIPRLQAGLLHHCSGSPPMLKNASAVVVSLSKDDAQLSLDALRTLAAPSALIPLRVLSCSCLAPGSFGAAGAAAMLLGRYERVEPQW